MHRRVTRKWRPPLTFVLAGTLAAIMAVPLVGIAYFRIAGGVLGWAETSWLLVTIAFFAMSILAILLWRLVLRPVWSLTAYAREMAKGTQNAQPPEHFGTPEISKLGDAVIHMGKTLRGREAVLRNYADHVTHELKSPLSAIQGAAELLAETDLNAADRDKMVGNIVDAANRMKHLLDAQRMLARAAEPLPDGKCRLSDAMPVGTDILVLNDGEIPISKDAFTPIATHLTTNARDHGATKITFKLDGQELTITDNGRGISPGNRERVFDPYFTTRRDGGGTGMGLSIVRRMLETYGAEIVLLDQEDTAFRISFAEQ